jgi:AraC-like DNA-binding protein
MGTVRIAPAMENASKDIDLFDSKAFEKKVSLPIEIASGSITTFAPSPEVGFSFLKQGAQKESHLVRTSTSNCTALSIYYEREKPAAPIWLEGLSHSRMRVQSGCAYMISPSSVLMHVAPACVQRDTVVLHIDLNMVRGLFGIDAFAELPTDAAALFEPRGEPALAPINFDPECRRILYQIEECKYVGFPRRLYLDAKALELAAMAFAPLVVEDTPSRGRLSARDSRKMDEARQYLEHHLRDGATLGQVAAAVGISVSKLKHDFKQAFGLSVHQFVIEMRLRTVSGLLRERNLSMKEAAYYVGYSNPSYFSRVYKHRLGTPPQIF